MEDKTHYGNQPKEIDAAYIDQLLSAPVVPKKEPEPQPEPTPVVSQPPAPAEPAAKPFPKPLLILIAIALLGTGFLLGRLSRPNPEPQPIDSTPTNAWNSDTEPPLTLPHPDGYVTEPGIAEDYASMSTQELVSLAVRIPGLSIFGNNGGTAMSTETYKALKEKNPVLVELVKRPGVVKELILYVMSGSEPNNIHAANALITYYGSSSVSSSFSDIYASCGMWIREIGDTYTVYEHTEAPVINYTAHESGMMMLDFGGDNQYALRGDLSGGIEEATFWYRIELNENAAAILANEPRPVPEIFLGLTQGQSDTWALIQPYEGGWFVYGHADDDISVSFTFHPNPEENTSQRISLSVYPQLGEDATAMEVAEYVLKQGTEILALQKIYGDLHYGNYPPLKRLTDTPGGISALLNLTQSKFDNFNILSSVQPPYMIALDILDLNAVRHYMTGLELRTFSVLMSRSGYFSLRTLTTVPIQEPNSAIPRWYLGNHRVGDTPEALIGMDINQLNYWSYVALQSEAQILRQENWNLDASLKDGSGVIGVWEVFDIDTGELVGWIVSGQFDSPQTICLQLMQGVFTLETKYHPSQLLS